MMPSASPSSQCGRGVKSKLRDGSDLAHDHVFPLVGADRDVGMRQIRQLEHAGREALLGLADHRLGRRDPIAEPTRRGDRLLALGRVFDRADRSSRPVRARP